MASKKISNMPGATDINDSDLITIVQEGTNKKIAKSDFVDDLGATGSIVQSGAADGTPVLEKSGTINSIRNVEDGPGVKASISAENGLKLSQNFTFNNTGVPLTSDSTILSPVIRSIAGGSGISVASSGDTVQISAVSGGGSSRTIIISQLSDFPAAVSGVITLEADKSYKLINSISTSSRFILNDQTSIEGDGVFGLTLTSTTTGNMFTSVDASNSMTQLRVSCPSGSLFSVSNPTALDSALLLSEVVVESALSLGTISGLSSFIMLNTGILSAANGFTFDGPFVFGNISGVSVVLTGGIAFDLATSTWGGLLLSNGMIHGTGVFLDGLTGSGNVAANGMASATNMRIVSGVTALNNISPDDSDWWFSGNQSIRDTRPGGFLSMTGNTTSTTITTIGAEVLVAGLWVVEEASQATGTTAGRITYDGSRDTDLSITFTATIGPVSGGAQDLSLSVAVNGAVIAESKRTATLSASGSVTGVWDYTMSAGDYVEIWTSNESTTNDILVSSAILRVH